MTEKKTKLDTKVQRDIPCSFIVTKNLDVHITEKIVFIIHRKR